MAIQSPGEGGDGVTDMQFKDEFVVGKEVADIRNMILQAVTHFMNLYPRQWLVIGQPTDDRCRFGLVGDFNNRDEARACYDRTCRSFGERLAVSIVSPNFDAKARRPVLRLRTLPC